jgi:hypothetical protein
MNLKKKKIRERREVFNKPVSETRGKRVSKKKKDQD